MMNRGYYFSRAVLVFLCMSLGQALLAQTVLVRSVAEMDERNRQLMGKYDSSVSFSVNAIDTSAQEKAFRFRPLPISLLQQYNTRNPYGWNDMGMIAAKGYQALLRGGVAVSKGGIDIQLQPELVFAMNPDFPVTNSYGKQNSGSYQKIFAGQSHIRFSAAGLSVGVSTENLWWGPGRRGALLMTNNAPGFTHLFFKSQRPHKTPIGSFEWQLIGGWLNGNNQLPFENTHLTASNRGTANRYLSGLSISYQPKWVPGLFLGFNRSIQTYASDSLTNNLGFMERYIAVLALATQKKNVANEDLLSRDQLASFFLRWVFPKSQAEFYLEYGFNDYGLNTRDYLLGPSHSAAYVTGISKIVSMGQNKWLDLNLELVQMSQTPDYLVRNSGNWYEHSQISEGYTHQNQILGSGIGFGANAVSLRAELVNGDKRLGFLLERIERDPISKAFKWIDLGLGFMPQWRKANIVYGGKLELVKTKNYGWVQRGSSFNLHAQVAVQWIW